MGRAKDVGASCARPAQRDGKGGCTAVKTATFLIAAVALVLGACAVAQDEVNPLSVKLGAYWPSGDLDCVGNTWFYGEVDYGFSRDYDRNSSWHVSVGWTQKSATVHEELTEGRSDGDYTTEYEEKYRIIPITVGMRYDQPMADTASGYWYWGWGVGLYMFHYEDDEYTDNETELGGCLYAGYEWPSGLFFEGKYQITSDIGDSDTNGNGFIAVVGVKLVK
jgi:hypothetical protein